MVSPPLRRMRVRLVLAGGLMALVALCLPGQQANADFGDLPSNLPRVGSSAVQFTVSGGSTTGSGGNLLYAPDTWIKLYTTGPGAKTLTVKIDDVSCLGTKTFTLYKVGANEHRGTSRAAGSLENGCGVAKSIHIPKGFLTASSREEHDGLYIGLLRVHMTGGSRVNGPLSTFRVTSSGVRMGSWGMYDSGGGGYVTGSSQPTVRERQYMQALLGRPSSHAEDNYKIEFKPMCDFFSGSNSRSIHLHWFDDDSGTNYQPRFQMYVTGSDGSRQNISARGGEGAPGSASITVKPNVRYTWHWDGITRVNGVQVYYPFDSGDFDLPCPSTGWKLNGKSSVNFSTVAFDYRTLHYYTGDPPGVAKPPDYSRGMRCSYYDNHHNDHIPPNYNKQHCQEWNGYYTKVDEAPGKQKAWNRTQAQTALQKVRFTHKLKNISGNGQKKWITAPGNAHKSDIQYYLDAVVKNFGYQDRPESKYKNWGSAIAPRAFPQHRASPTRIPLADDKIKPMLNNPHPGDKYCERINTHDSASSTGGTDNSPGACVRLSDTDRCEGDPWNVEAYSTIKQTDGNGSPITGPLGNGVNDAWVGEQYGFFYAFGNSGPADRTSNISFYSYPGLNPGIGGTTPLSVPNPFGTALYAPLNPGAATLWWQTGRDSSRQIQPLDGGRTYSFYARYAPAYGHWDSTGGGDCDHGGAGQTPTLTVAVPWYYQLHPQVALNNEPIVQQGTPLHVDPQAVLNSIDPNRGDGDRYNTCANEFDWQLRTTAQKPDTPTVKENVPPGNEDGHKNPRDICPNGNPGSAQALSSGKSIDTSVFPAGTKLCAHLTISPSTEGGGSASADKCTTVVKAPKVQFWNSDVNAGRHFEQPDNSPTCGQQLASLGDADITTSGPPTSVASNNLYGSWVEHGAFASGAISSFGSAAENKTGSFGVSSTGQRLTFGNDSQLGQFDYSDWCIPNYDKLFEVQRGQADNLDTLVGSTIDLGNLDANHYYTDNQAGNITLENIGNIDAGKQDITLNMPQANVVIKGGTIKRGVRLVIHAKGSVTIKGNIAYQSTGYASIDDIPRVVIIAGGTATGNPDDPDLGLTPNITVDEDVTRVDAWLIAHGTLYTCDTDPTSFDYHSRHCAKQLTINGPVAAHDIKLRRTFGADLTKPLDQRGPAEVFNLNPDSLLGSYSAARRDYFVDVYQRDLPPRY